MIFPLLRGLLWFHRAPAVWLMVALNVGVFAWTYPAYRAADLAIDNILDDDGFVETNGMVFATHLLHQPRFLMDRYPSSLRTLASRSVDGDIDAKSMLGHMALRQGPFMTEMKRLVKTDQGIDRIKGDAVRIEKWSETVARLGNIQAVHPSFRLGLSFDRTEPWRFFTYQVAHSGLMHLFWNMIFLLLFGTFVEHTRGSGAVLLTMWFGGLGGALAFIGFSGLSASPLVGASAAVSALIALSASHGHRRLPFVFWLLPMKGYYGVTWLPAWVLVPAFLLPDLAGWMAAQPGLGAVAYTAHVGGAVVGLLMGTLFPERAGAFEEMAQGLTGTVASLSKLSV